MKKLTLLILWSFSLFLVACTWEPMDQWLDEWDEGTDFEAEFDDTWADDWMWTDEFDDTWADDWMWGEDIEVEFEELDEAMEEEMEADYEDDMDDVEVEFDFE